MYILRGLRMQIGYKTQDLSDRDLRKTYLKRKVLGQTDSKIEKILQEEIFENKKNLSIDKVSGIIKSFKDKKIFKKPSSLSFLFVISAFVFLNTSTANALMFADIEIGATLGADLRDGGYLNKSNQNSTGAQAGTQSVTITNSGITNTKLAYGFYARAWIGPMVKVAPFIKYDGVVGVSSADVAYQSGNVSYNLTSYKNMQYGLLLGVRIPLIALTPYLGMSYSQFFGSDMVGTYAINYGIKWDVFMIPLLTLGIDGSYQNPKVTGSDKTADINRIQLSVGLQF